MSNQKKYHLKKTFIIFQTDDTIAKAEILKIHKYLVVTNNTK